jgi:transketolase
MTPQTSQLLKDKARQVWRETLLLHRRAPETRVASSLSCIEILVALYYGGILKFDPKQPQWSERDRFLISKGHGSISMYPILADLGFFPAAELKKISQPCSFLGSIPDPVIPGYETINGSLGHGLGVGCGMAVGLNRKKSSSNVFVLVGDGELYEGSNWEAIMFAAHHRLDNLTMIVDHNKISMLDFCSEIIDHSPLAEKFKAFGWLTEEVDGHDLEQVHPVLSRFGNTRNGQPKVLIAHTIKGKGGGPLENDKLSHIKSLNHAQIDLLLEGGGCQ